MIDQDELLELSDIVEKINYNLFTEEINTNEKLLMILNKDSGLSPYSHEFVQGFQDPQVLSGFISAISSFIGEVTGKVHGHWKTVFGTDSLILVESGHWSIGVLVASKETIEIRSKLRRIIREFEDCFEFLRDIEGIQYVFSDFDSYIRRMFVDERITNRTVVTKIPEWRASLYKFDLPSTAFEVSKVLLGFQETATIDEIKETQNIGLEKIIEIISIASWNGIVKLTYVPSDDDILDLSEKASTILFNKSNPMGITSSCLRTVARFDGRTPLSRFYDEHIEQDKKSLLRQLGSLINTGLVQRISIEKRAVLLDECILSQLMEKGSSIVGSLLMKQYFDLVIDQGSTTHPRINRILLLDTMKVRCLLEESMTPDELDDMYDALEYVIKEISKYLSKSCSVSLSENLLKKIYDVCHKKWEPYLSDVII
jgi:hypothetical protein